MRQFRCEGEIVDERGGIRRCNKLLFKGNVMPGSHLEAVCPGHRCKHLTVFDDFADVMSTTRLVPDGAGGYVLTPAESKR